MVTEQIRNIPIARPLIGEEEKQAVMRVLESGQLTAGQETEAFEAEFAAYHGARYGVAMSNGTTALMAMMLAHGFQPGDEVIIPAFSFFATASCVHITGATPVFADIDPETYCLSPEAVEAAITPRTVAIMPVHLYGCPADMPRFQAICEKHGLVLLEDAAQAHGATIDNRHIGTWGTAGFSFYPTKNMTTSEGGMVLTNDEAIARKLRLARNQGMNQQYFHEMIGYNFRMTNIAAAIGRVQLRHLPTWTQKRIHHADYLNTHLKTVKTPTTPAGTTHVYHQYTVRVTDGVDRDVVVKVLNARGIGARVYYPLPIHRQPVYRQEITLPETETATAQVFSLPVHPGLSTDDLEFIAQEVNTLC